jgi:hypothetical protein
MTGTKSAACEFQGRKNTMDMPLGTDRTRLLGTTESAIRRDHGMSPRITRAFLDPFSGLYAEFEIGGIVWKYDLSGRLIDAYRWTVTGLGEGRRTEVERQRLKVQPAAVGYSPTSASAFFDAAARGEGGLYEGARKGAGSCYRVFDAGREIGIVVQVRFTAAEVTYQPLRQWLAMDAEGRVWSSYGRTREETARHLLTDEARSPATVRLAA